ncbi:MULTISPECIES: 2-amino-4-hydroxy-6-hydroxymethyldihydropteridine diphosphokinase [Mesobacillus]|uniref:2-amino-4-hydroxy-6-hydroxymethyldihydropteridine diphosphokinase n=2 Tax=Mesobacillus TaxID=2675231 RepID=A0A0D6ZEB8_9BACI|nr:MULTISPECIES: 2-amino-4-hydroxy-6-hydroxymethyldihydropteridine diphosphokinase [Mesobacillus]KIY22933.1 2-amino-4-hydroxy-6-hydroxymethyldihydropteridine pyrophosphokinase [Mesobacillus subterraneus]MDQ0414879.1 2-amino-4-hydroxy-6-hydroxymethyldihydropteridine diphosphokinase [Mesobacillus stamsii]
MENKAYIALGSNLGDRFGYLTQAIILLEGQEKISVINTSSIYETDPVGYTEQDQFLNMVIKVATSLSPVELLDTCLDIELKLGRKREIKWGPRTLDLDILLYNHEIVETEKLTLPHPRMSERAFVILPLLEMDPYIKLPNAREPLANDLLRMPDREGVRIWKQKNGEDVFALIES